MSHILTLSDRTVIQTLLKVGYSQKQIAEEVGVAPSTINYELKRCPKGYYDADQAQEDCEKKLTHRGRVFDVSTATVQWLSTGFLLVNGIMIPISALLADNVPTKRLYLITMLIFFCGTLIAFQAHSFAALLVGRLIQAVGVGVVLPLLQIMMLEIFPANQRGQAMGLAGIVVGLAPAISPTLAGYILDHGSWRILFGILLPIIAFVLFGALFFMKDVLPGKPSQLDLWSTITSTLGFGSLLYGFSTAANDGWGDAKVLIALAVGLVFIALFIHRQLTMERPSWICGSLSTTTP